MHKEILTSNQIKLFPLLKRQAKDFGLVGGTAVALHIGHRRSIDFDLFSLKPFDSNALRSKVRRLVKIERILVDQNGELTCWAGKVKLTFFHYPFAIKYKTNLDTIIKMPDLLTLAAMKAHALGRRAKWKDYVDLYFIIKYSYPVKKIIQKGKAIFGGEFNGKIFRTQLAYFEDINYEEKIDFLPKFSVSEEKIKKDLISFGLEQ